MARVEEMSGCERSSATIGWRLTFGIMDSGRGGFDPVAQEMMATLSETIVQVDDDGFVVWVNRADSVVFTTPPTGEARLSDLVVPEAVEAVSALLRSAEPDGDAVAEYTRELDLVRVKARRLVSSPTTMATFKNITAIRSAGQTIVDLVRDRSVFLEAVSNELRSPLSAVIGYATLLSDEDSSLDDSTRAEIVRGMTDRAWDLAGIVEDLLTIASGELGELHLAKVRVNLGANVAQVVESIGGMGDAVAIAAGPAVDGVGDPARFRQVVRNLLSNALRHGADPVTVSIGEADDCAYVAIGDSGGGLSEEIVGLIEEERPSSPGAMGLGLWICHELTKLLGGELRYDRVDGRSIFTASIPLL